ncbi:MAG: radical SAM protein [Thermodesulfobacteriota bacterium]
MRRKILLINLNTRWFGLKFWFDIPYGLCILRAALKKDHQVRLLDANLLDLDEEGLMNTVRDYEPDVVGISCLSMEYRKTLFRTARLVKKARPFTPVVVGGIYPTLLPEEIVAEKSIDYIVMGEGEHRLPRLLDHLFDRSAPLEDIDGLVYRKGDRVVYQKTATYIENLDQVPYPDYTDLDVGAYFGSATRYSYYTYPRRFPYVRTITSRGCPFRCIFCSSRAINGETIRYRSAGSVLGEIDELVGRYQVREIIFLDDNLILDRARITAILKGLVERNYDLEWKSTSTAVYALDGELLTLMRQSGCYQLTLAIEAGTQEALRLIRKPLRLDKAREVVGAAKALGFEIGGSFVFGLPGETWDQIRETFRFAESLDIDYCAFNIATPLPKTELYDICQKNGYLVHDFHFDDSRFNGFGMPNIVTPEFSPEELLVLRAFEWDRINFKTPEKIAKIASMNGLTLEEVEKWRLNTRRNATRLIQGKLAAA